MVHEEIQVTCTRSALTKLNVKAYYYSLNNNNLIQAFIKNNNSKVLRQSLLSRKHTFHKQLSFAPVYN